MKALRALSLVAAAGLAATAAVASPTNFSFRGNFNQDDDVQLFNFSVGASSAVTLVSYGYAGGTQADGTVITRGGFDTILALFNAATGAFISQNDDGAATCGPVSIATDPLTGRRYDTCLNATLAAGDYVVGVMEFNNFAVGGNLSAGFQRAGAGNFTATNSQCTQGRFCDVSGTPVYTNRTSAWAFDILNVDAATTNRTPEPSALALVGVALAGLSLLTRKKRVA
jgi:hypothetical protein